MAPKPPPGFHAAPGDPAVLGVKYGRTPLICPGPYPGVLEDDINPEHKILSCPNSCVCSKAAGSWGTCLTGLSSGLTGAFCNCVETAKHALAKRHLAAIPETSFEDPEKRPALMAAASLLGARMRTSYCVMRDSYPRETWMARWPAHKQDAFKRETDVWASSQAMLGDKAWTLHSEVCKLIAYMRAAEADRKNPVSELKAMVKREPMILNFDGKAPTKPRLIQFYKHLSEQARFGPHHFALQKALCDVANVQGYEVSPGIFVTVASALSPAQKGEWYTNATAWAGPEGRGVERDGERWDSTLGEFAFDAQLASMHAAGVDDEFLRHIRDTATCRATYNNKGTDSGRPLRWELKFTTKSGHNDTTWRNSLYNLLISALAFEAVADLEAVEHPFLPRLQARIMVIGDDMIAFTNRPFDQDALLAEERKYGIIPEMAIFRPHQFARMEFASDCFMPCVLPEGGAGHVPVPKIGKLTGRLFWTHTDVPRRKRDDFRASVAYGMRNLLMDLPVYGDFLRANLVGGKTKFNTQRWFQDAPERVQYDPVAVDIWFADRYGLHPTDFDEVVAMWNENAGRVGVISHPVTDKVVEFDTAGPGERARDDYAIFSARPAENQPAFYHGPV